MNVCQSGNIARTSAFTIPFVTVSQNREFTLKLMRRVSVKYILLYGNVTIQLQNEGRG